MQDIERDSGGIKHVTVALDDERRSRRLCVVDVREIPGQCDVTDQFDHPGFAGSGDVVTLDRERQGSLVGDLGVGWAVTEFERTRMGQAQHTGPDLQGSRAVAVGRRW